MHRLVITLLIGTAFGYLVKGFGVPGGIMVGSILGVTIINVISNVTYIPYFFKFIAQVITGAYIGSTLKKNKYIDLSIFLSQL